MTVCRVCVEPTTGQREYHPSCVERLFGTATLPNLDFKLSELYAVAAQMAGKMSISGVQEKISLKLAHDKSKLDVAETGGRFILKPEQAKYSSLPQNEHVTMRLASFVEIETPPIGLLPLKDQTLAYIIKRFDRLDDGSKLHVEDFCQLAERPLRDKYNGSGELCVRLLRKYASEPLLEILKLYRLLLFGWWVANGDMHLKNLSLITRSNGTRGLSPAYDLVSTKLVLPMDDTTALSIGGNKKNLTKRRWLEFAQHCQIPKRAAERVITSQIKALGPSIEMIRRSFLPADKKEEYEKLIRENTAMLGDKSE
jgi:serine/threonine-protein kinase HipA